MLCTFHVPDLGEFLSPTSRSEKKNRKLGAPSYLVYGSTRRCYGYSTLAGGVEILEIIPGELRASHVVSSRVPRQTTSIAGSALPYAEGEGAFVGSIARNAFFFVLENR